MLSQEDFNKKEHSARWALYYIDTIASKLGWKLKSLKSPTEEFKVLVHDDTHNYDSEGIKLAKSTFERRNFNIELHKFRTMTNGGYAYIFKMSRKV